MHIFIILFFKVTAMRSSFSSKVVFASCVWYFDRAYVSRFFYGLHAGCTRRPYTRKTGYESAEAKEWGVSILMEMIYLLLL